MKKTIQLAILITSVFLMFAPASFAQAAPASNDTAIENAILFHINAYRQQHGLTKLTMNTNMVREAKIHSADMAAHRMPFGHKAFATRINRLHKQVKNSGAGAENVAYNYKDAQDVVKNWLRSPGHKRNIDGNYNVTGIGVVRDSHGKLYFTQIFLNTNNSNKYATHRPVGRFFRKAFF